MRVVGAMASLNWGDVPTWLGVLFAATAGVVAFLLYRVESNRDQRAEAELRRRADDERRQQAVRVCGWYGLKRFDPPPPHVTSIGLNQAWGALMRNASDLPVYDVTVRFHFSSPQVNNGAVGSERGYAEQRVVPPGETFLRPPEGMLRNVKQHDVYVISFTFRDSANRRWRREPDGTLMEINDDG